MWCGIWLVNSISQIATVYSIVYIGICIVNVLTCPNRQNVKHTEITENDLSRTK